MYLLSSTQLYVVYFFAHYYRTVLIYGLLCIYPFKCQSHTVLLLQIKTVKKKNCCASKHFEGDTLMNVKHVYVYVFYILRFTVFFLATSFK